MKRKSMDEALKLVQEVLKRKPWRCKSPCPEGRYHDDTQDYASAIAEYRAVLYEEPQNIPIALGLARAHLLNNEPLLAEQTYKNILKQNPGVTQARFALADIYRRRGEIDLATDQLEKVLEREPENIKALSALGAIALKKEP